MWFQYKIIHNILGVNKLLNKIGINENDRCRLCNTETETSIHLFFECQITQKFWNEVINYVYGKSRIRL